MRLADLDALFQNSKVQPYNLKSSQTRLDYTNEYWPKLQTSILYSASSLNEAQNGLNGRLYETRH